MSESARQGCAVAVDGREDGGGDGGAVVAVFGALVEEAVQEVPEQGEFVAVGLRLDVEAADAGIIQAPAVLAGEEVVAAFADGERCTG